MRLLPRLNNAAVRSLWLVRVLWLSLPLTAGPLFADTLDARSAALRRGVSLSLWIAWVVVLMATALPRPMTLTLVRVVAVAAVGAAAWAAGAGDVDGTALVSIAAALVVAGVAGAAATGEAFVDAASYGDERRFLLRPPAALLLGPIPLATAAVAVGVSAGPLLLMARQWTAGATATVAGLAAAFVGARALDRLTRRWVVFVPAGAVIHDHLALSEPTLFRRDTIHTFAAAPADAQALDLTQQTYGLAVLIECDPLPLVRITGRSTAGPQVSATAVLLAPTRPGAVIAEAHRRNIARPVA